MNFERGKDPKESIGIGIDARIKEVEGIILREEDFRRGWDRGFPRKKKMPDLNDIIGDSSKAWEYSIIVAVIGERYKILKSRHGVPGGKIKEEGEVKDSGPVLDELIKEAKSFLYDLSWSTMSNVKFSPITYDLVPVSPMSSPKGEIFYLDYKYKKRNIFKRIQDAIRKIARPKS